VDHGSAHRWAPAYRYGRNGCHPCPRGQSSLTLSHNQSCRFMTWYW
jgi:hypothetical protein